MPPYRLVIFDFDGTLADSLPWFRSVFSDMADRFGFARLTPDEMEALRGLSAREIIARMKVPAWRLPRIVSHMRREKLAAAASTPLFAGAAACLADLRAAGVETAIVSSDSDESVRAVLGEAAASIDHFDCGASLFGKAAKFRALLKRTGVAASDALCVGDEIRDIEAARDAGTAAGAVAWGYTLPEALAARAPDHMFADVEAMRRMLLP
ncbi:HAD family hydrolase [Brevundimonas naejangsanensis]|uniref:HAD family hydrolase n=1 Tax=Brevundimonas naejangsanensis TaxID=588932 RepID=A0A494RLM7_9CAUL|nr:HAD hydrolase-like protein [Brevundimonas naejangsanensis]AYG96329.1 HAD family hydrolase [Brevundimonas naejangsanensis]